MLSGLRAAFGNVKAGSEAVATRAVLVSGRRLACGHSADLGALVHVRPQSVGRRRRPRVGRVGLYQPRAPLFGTRATSARANETNGHTE
jgi:hypothetical protein